MTLVEQKMLATLLVSQLPPDQIEAMLILGLAGELVKTWIFAPKEGAKEPIPFPRPVEAR